MFQIIIYLYELFILVDILIKSYKINSSIIDNWYNKYPEYGMIYVDKKNKSNIVALSIIIPLEYKTWEKLIKGECFENNINIKWDSNDNNIGVHLYHIEVLNRTIMQLRIKKEKISGQ